MINFRNNCLLILLIMGMAGCSSTTICNKTPAMVPQNSSEIYPIEMSVVCKGSRIIADSCASRIIINGEIHPMEKVGNYDFIYNYKRPRDSHKASYYYEVDYKEDLPGPERSRTITSGLCSLAVANRYVIGFENNRGLPEAEVSLLGRGFEEGDVVEIGGEICYTCYISNNVLNFVVPWMRDPGEYHARLLSDNGDIGLGNFQIDPLIFHTDEKELIVSKGEKKVFVINIDIPAPKNGISIDVTTNIPDSVIMKDYISISPGATSTIAIVQGRGEGAGMLYLTAIGFEELKIPIEVIPEHSEGDDESLEEQEVEEEFLTL